MEVSSIDFTPSRCYVYSNECPIVVKCGSNCQKKCCTVICKQFIFYNGISSDVKSITCGVPQGSVLGPLLFLLYINDLPNISDKLNFFLFADDTNIYYESDNLKELEKTVNEELKQLCLWLNLNRLALNVGKQIL